MKTINLMLKVKLVVKTDDDVNIFDVVNEMDYHFADTTETATVEDAEIVETEVTDSR